MKDHLLYAKNIWNYLAQAYPVKPSDFMLVLGSSDLNVARYAARFWMKKFVDYVVISGGLGKLTKSMWLVSEASKFAQIMVESGVPEAKILLEEKATNTGENIVNSKKIITSLGLSCETGILITKPYMNRRAFNTAAKQWPEVDWTVSSENIDFESYLRKQADPNKFINIMVGDLQRIKIYADKGFQVEEHIPENVWESFCMLVHLGFDEYLVK